MGIIYLINIDDDPIAESEKSPVSAMAKNTEWRIQSERKKKIDH